MQLESILQEHNINYRTSGQHHHVRQGWVGIDCPFCGTQDKYHLGIHTGTRVASCWKCGRHTLVEVLSAALQIRFGEAKRLITGLGWVDQRATSVAKRQHQLKLPQGIGPLQTPHQRYLRGRQFDPDEISKLWEVQAFGIHPRFNWRLWLPIHFADQVVSWTTRSIGEEGMRYINAKPTEESLSPKSILYGLHYVRSTVVICEGPTDAWRLGPGTVATMGLQYTQKQIAWMSRFPERYVCFDSSVDAQARAGKLAELLSLLPGSTHILTLDAEDPGSASRKEVSRVRRYVFGDSHA